MRDPTSEAQPQEVVLKVRPEDHASGSPGFPSRSQTSLGEGVYGENGVPQKLYPSELVNGTVLDKGVFANVIKVGSSR